MSGCGCNLHKKGLVINQSDLDISEAHTKALGELDPLGFLSGSAFVGYERMLFEWLRGRILNAANIIFEQEHPSTQAMGEALIRSLLESTDFAPKELRDFLEVQIESGTKMGAAELGPEFVPEITLPDIEQTVDRQVQQFTAIGNHAAKTELGKIVAQGLRNGDTINDMTKRIQAWAKSNGDMDRALRSRARTIARTESSRSLVSGQIESWKASGVVSEIEWVLAPNACQFCRALYQRGKSRVPLGKPGDPDVPFLPFPSTLLGTQGGRMKLDYRPITGPPLHPNCRCALKPIVEL